MGNHLQMQLMNPDIISTPSLGNRTYSKVFIQSQDEDTYLMLHFQEWNTTLNYI
jgi:hypothetical protein